jgi:adenylylsulfate kinase-like enzyme
VHRGSSKRNSDVEVHHGRGLLALSPAALVRPWFSPATGLETRSPAEIGHFIEIYVKCALDVYIDREVKGLYAKALRGEIAVFPGVADPYEVPLAPEVIVETARESPEESLTKILQRRLLTEVFRLPLWTPARKSPATS